MTDDRQFPEMHGPYDRTGTREETDKPAGQNEDRPARHIPGKEYEIPLQESREKLSRIFSTTRHDINNQLTVINGYLSLLETPGPAVKSSDIIRILQGATSRIGRILQFTREYQNIGEKPPLWQVPGGTILLAKSELETGQVRLTIGSCCDEVEVLADPLLVRVFYHLLDNSLRHGGKVSEIQIHCSVDGDRLVITCEDNGVGIPDRIRPLLFTLGKGKNGGYGLFLVREILAITGFTITETGQAGRGALFEIIVPEGSFRQAETHPQP